MRVRGAVCLCGLLGAVLGVPAAAVAAGGSGATPSTSASATAAGKGPTATTAGKGPTATTAGKGPTATAATTVSPTPSGAGALGGGLTAPGPPATATTTTPTVISTATASTSGSGGLSGTSAIIIAVGAFVILAGISYFIWRDARRRAPVAARPAGESRENRPGSKAPPKARKLSAAERRRRKRGRAKR